MPESHEHRNGWGRIAIVAVISVLVTSGVWNFLTQDKPTRVEIQEALQEIRAQMRENQKELREEIRQLRLELTRYAAPERSKRQ